MTGVPFIVNLMVFKPELEPKRAFTLLLVPLAIACVEPEKSTLQVAWARLPLKVSKRSVMVVRRALSREAGGQEGEVLACVTREA